MGAASDQKIEAERIAASTPPHGSLAAALVAALADLTVVETGRTAKIPMKSGGEFSYKYADIADVVKLTRPVLARHGIVALTPVHAHGDGLACTVVFMHESGQEFRSEPLSFPHGRDAQATGSAITYHRRYALVAALGMAAGDDDDGAAAKPRPVEIEWNVGMVKADLLNLCDGDKEKAALVWSESKGDTRVPASSTARFLLDDWLEHQPAAGE